MVIHAPVRKRTKNSREARLIAVILGGGLLILVVFFGLPMVDLVFTSLSRWSGVGDRAFVGGQNYLALLSDTSVHDALARDSAPA